MRRLALPAALSLGLLAAAQAVAAADYVVVVNEKNPTTHISRAELSRVFLKRTATWPDGSSALPFDLSATSPVRAAFTLGVHKKPFEVIRAFWDQEIYSGRSVPPKALPTDQAMLHELRGTPGAVGYVSAGADLGPGLKVLVLDP